jgi:hypothetical protein
MPPVRRRVCKRDRDFQSSNSGAAAILLNVDIIFIANNFCHHGKKRSSKATECQSYLLRLW